MADIQKTLHTAIHFPIRLKQSELEECKKFLETLNFMMNAYADATYEAPDGNDIGMYIRKLDWYINNPKFMENI